jgi:pimeloyl-ACP methyl ester carboxylesterase
MSFSTVAGAIDSVIVMLHESQYSMNELAMDMATNFYHPPPSVVLSEPAKGEWPSRSSLAVVTIACDDATPSSIASAVDSLAETVGECNTAILGHGLGGTMAMWAALRCLLPSSSSGDDNKSVAGANPIFAPSVSLSMNAPLDLKWALEQRHIDKSLPWIRPNGSDAATIHWESPIDVLPPATRSLRLREASRPRNLFLPANCYLGVIHGDDDAVIPAAHGIRFTVAACVGGVEVELHRMKREGGHCDCLDPSSDSWRAAKDIIRRGWTSGTSRATPVMTIGWEEMVDPQRMRPTQRDETGSEVIIRTHR